MGLTDIIRLTMAILLLTHFWLDFLISLDKFSDPILMGILYSERLRGNEVFSFDSNNTLTRAKTPQVFCQLSCYKTPGLNRLCL